MSNVYDFSKKVKSKEVEIKKDRVVLSSPPTPITVHAPTKFPPSINEVVSQVATLASVKLMLIFGEETSTEEFRSQPVRDVFSMIYLSGFLDTGKQFMSIVEQYDNLANKLVEEYHIKLVAESQE